MLPYWVIAPKPCRAHAQAGSCHQLLSVQVFLLLFCNIGISHWCKYIEIVKGRTAEPLPARVDDIVAWSMTFRCLGTFGNYLGHVRTMSCALGFEPPAVGHPAIRRAMGAIAKRALFSPRYCRNNQSSACMCLRPMYLLLRSGQGWLSAELCYGT